MSNTPDQWSLDSTVSTGQPLIVNIGKESGYKVNDGIVITESNFLQYELDIAYFPNYNPAQDRFLLFDISVDGSDTRTQIVKRPVTVGNPNGFYYYLILLLPTTNTEKRKIVKTSEKISPI